MKKLLTISLVALSGFAFVLGFINEDPNGSKTPVTDQGTYVSGVNTSYGTPVFTDNFDAANDTTDLKARGYKVYYRGTGPQGSTATWFQGNSTVFAAFNGPTTGYVAANYNVVTGTNNIDSWLVLPRLTGGTLAGDSLYFYSRSATGSTYPDSIRVMYSANDSIPEGAWTELGRFKTNTTTGWEKRGFRAPTASANGRFAIRYCVANGGPSGANSDYIGIDALTIERSAAPPVSVNRALKLATPGVNTTYVQVPYMASMVGFGNNITIEAWIKPGGTTTAATVLNKGVASFDYQLGVSLSTMLPFFRAGSTIATCPFPIQANVWQHLAVVSTGSTVTFYLNGVPGAPVTAACILGSSANEMRIGRGNSDAGSGWLDEIRVWSVARTAPQILSNVCNKWIPNNTTGLKAQWHFDSTWVDSVSGWNGVPQGLATFDTLTFCPIVTNVPGNETTLPTTFRLEQNYPNPFNPVTTIKFSIPKNSYVELKLYDMLGKEVATLVSDPYSAGEYRVDFNASNLPSGTYFYRITAGNFMETKKMVLIK